MRILKPILWYYSKIKQDHSQYGGGGPQVGGVTCLFIQSLILIWLHLHDRWGDHNYETFMNRHVTPPKRLPLLPGVPHLRVNKPLVTKVWGKGCWGGSHSASYQHPFPPLHTQPWKTEWTVTSSKIAGELSHRFFFAFFFIFSWIVLTKSSDQRHGFALFSIFREGHGPLNNPTANRVRKGQRRLEFTQSDKPSFYKGFKHTNAPHWWSFLGSICNFPLKNVQEMSGRSWVRGGYGRTAFLVNNKPFFPYQNTWALQSMYAARKSSYRDHEMIEKSNLTGQTLS